jgi:hypothetical protein
MDLLARQFSKVELRIGHAGVAVRPCSVAGMIQNMAFYLLDIRGNWAYSGGGIALSGHRRL